MKEIRKIFVAVFFCFGIATWVLGQDEPISITNPSFEDTPHAGVRDQFTNVGTKIGGWKDCGFPRETPPDIHMNSPEFDSLKWFKVSQKAVQGNTFLGMVVRDNDTWESLSQRLVKPLAADKCYSFSLFLARSSVYVSLSRITGQEANYTNPVMVKVWGGFNYCDKREMLGEVGPVQSTEWKEYVFRLESSKAYTHIIIEAFYKTPVLFPYNGNVLLDHASMIQPIPCDEEETPLPPREYPEPEVLAQNIPINKSPKAVVPPNPRRDRQVKPLEVPEEKPVPPVTDKPGPEEEIAATEKEEEDSRIMRELNRNYIKIGQTIRIEQLNFASNSAEIQKGFYPVLDEIYQFMEENSDVVIEIGGHTNTLPDHEFCEKLSQARAKAVVQYLIDKDISPERLSYRGYGKKNPIEPNDKNNMAARAVNQRVEVKIISMEG